MQVQTLVAAADAVGDKLRYSHQGFLANVRMLRMGGLAAIELAQTISTAVRMHRCQALWVPCAVALALSSACLVLSRWRISGQACHCA